MAIEGFEGPVTSQVVHVPQSGYPAPLHGAFEIFGFRVPNRAQETSTAVDIKEILVSCKHHPAYAVNRLHPPHTVNVRGEGALSPGFLARSSYWLVIL